MKRKNTIYVILLVFILCMLVPSRVKALVPPSFDAFTGDYQFYKFLNVQNTTSAVTGFTIPEEGTQWMVEVDVATNFAGWDIVNGTIYKETGNDVDYYWNTSDVFGSTSYEFGRYNGSYYQIGSDFENIFPVPFMTPIDTQAIDNELNRSLSRYFQNFVSENISALLLMMSEFVDSPLSMFSNLSLMGIYFAWNGTDWYKGLSSSQTVGPINGSATWDTLLAAIYIVGELQFLGEFWWDNSTFTWNTRYQLGTPFWEAFGFMFEMLIPGLGEEFSSEMIPGFPFVTVLLGLLLGIAVLYLKISKLRTVKEVLP